MSPNGTHFLTDIGGKGGPWDGWNSYAVGPLLCIRHSSGPTPQFQVVFVKKEMTAEQMVGEGSEMVGAKEEMKSEGFFIVQSAHVGHSRRGNVTYLYHDFNEVWSCLNEV